MTGLVRAETRGDVLRLTLNDPQTRNSLSDAMMDGLLEPLVRASAKVVVIAATGTAFSSGHNLKEITQHRRDNDQGAAAYAALFAKCSELMLAITRYPGAVVAEVDGLASAAGCQLVASCDLAFASTRASFCTPGVNIGLFCSTPMVALSRAVGRKDAMAMLLTGAVIPAAEALRMGLVNAVVTPEALPGMVAAKAEEIAAKSAIAIAIGKAAFDQQMALPLAQAYQQMSAVMSDNLQRDEAREGIDAFLAKRSPTWPNR
jgi:enoyl-CoA hydratase/carnithine racemase